MTKAAGVCEEERRVTDTTVVKKNLISTLSMDVMVLIDIANRVSFCSFTNILRCVPWCAELVSQKSLNSVRIGQCFMENCDKGPQIRSLNKISGRRPFQLSPWILAIIIPASDLCQCVHKVPKLWAFECVCQESTRRLRLGWLVRNLKRKFSIAKSTSDPLPWCVCLGSERWERGNPAAFMNRIDVLSLTHCFPAQVR